MANRTTLEKGIKGNMGAISLLQTFLAKLEYTIECDGIFGEKTKEIVIDFQKKNALRADGVVESKTWEKLERLSKNEESSLNPFSSFETKFDTKNPDILLEVVRISTQKDCTLGVLFNVSNNGAARQFICFTFEDEKFSSQISGKTRISSGNYRVTLQQEGLVNNAYKDLYQEYHKGVLWIRNTSGFDQPYIYTDEATPTPGSLLVGNAATHKMTRSSFVANSGKAYRRIYPVISDAIASGKKVVIRFSNFA